MDVISLYSFSSLGWLTLQAVPMIVWPTFVCTLLTEDYQRGNALEEYFTRTAGFAQLTVGLLVVVLSGALPLTSSVETPADAPSPYASAVILVSSLYHGATAFYTYARLTETAQTGFALGCAGSSVLAAVGLWALLFGGERGHVSRRTGADKRTSGFPFGNAEADKRRLGKAR